MTQYTQHTHTFTHTQQQEGEEEEEDDDEVLTKILTPPPLAIKEVVAIIPSAAPGAESMVTVEW
jgi:hypothetical protein